METWQAINTVRVVRKFSDEPIEDEHLERILNAGRRMPEPSPGLLTTIGWGLGDEVDYALEASVFVTGAGVQWLRDGLGIVPEAADTERMAASLDSNDDVYFVPALTGLGSPHWDPYARGTIVACSTRPSAAPASHSPLSS